MSQRGLQIPRRRGARRHPVALWVREEEPHLRGEEVARPREHASARAAARGLLSPPRAIACAPGLCARRVLMGRAVSRGRWRLRLRLR